MDLIKVVGKYNDDGMTLEQIANELGSSKTTISRLLKKNGWKLDKKAKKYISESSIGVNNEPVNNEYTETTNNIIRETKMINYTIALNEDMAKALRVKCAIEGTKMAKVIREALEKVIEDKYYKF